MHVWQPKYLPRLREIRSVLLQFLAHVRYISDYLNILGLQIWQEQLNCIIEVLVNQECKIFKEKIYPIEAVPSLQAASVSLPSPIDVPSFTFIGRVTRELLVQTEPRNTSFLNTRTSWSDRDGKELVGIGVMSLLHRAIGSSGLRGVDETLSFFVYSQLHTILDFIQKHVKSALQHPLSVPREELRPMSRLPNESTLLYRDIFHRTATLWPSVATALSRIGQAQLLRQQVAFELNSRKIESPLLVSVLEAMNESLLRDFSYYFKHSLAAEQTQTDPFLKGGLLYFFPPYLDSMGLSNPLHEIYVNNESPEDVSLFCMLFSVAQLTNYSLDSSLNLVPYDNGGLDFSAMTVGIVTVLNQQHSSCLKTFVLYLLLYVRCKLATPAEGVDSKTHFSEVSKVLAFIKNMSKLPTSVVVLDAASHPLL